MKHVLGLCDMKKEEIFQILDAAHSLKPLIDEPARRTDTLRQRSAVTLFYEDSTRTKMSFLMAGEYLGMRINDMPVAASSVNKGETLMDTAQNLAAMGINTIIMRHRQTAAPHKLAEWIGATTSIINGGDGANEHPTQALLDIMTMEEAFGRENLKNLRVTIVGDIAHSRVARSNLFGLTTLGASVTLAGPTTLLSPKMAALRPRTRVTHDIKDAIKDADVVMGLRIQHERQKTAPFPSLNEYIRFFSVDSATVDTLCPNALIMHPGPVNRGVEMDCQLLDSQRSVILRQAKNGVAIRMALLSICQEHS